MFDKIVDYTAKNFLKFILRLNIIIIILFLLQYSLFPKIAFYTPINNEQFIYFFYTTGSNLISLASILLGIYFTIFTLLSNPNFNSSVSNLNQETFNHLIQSIKIGFSVTFIYVFFLIGTLPFKDTLIENNNTIFSILNLVHLLLCFSILLLALNIAILLYAAYKVDITNFQKIKT